eukprot:2101555-Amphidinium_carterae.1
MEIIQYRRGVIVTRTLEHDLLSWTRRVGIATTTPPGWAPTAAAADMWCGGGGGGGCPMAAYSCALSWGVRLVIDWR